MPTKAPQKPEGRSNSLRAAGAAWRCGRIEFLDAGAAALEAGFGLREAVEALPRFGAGLGEVGLRAAMSQN
jgi:hypothetical protein